MTETKIKQSSTSEYAAVRGSGAGLIDLSSRGRILVTGSEAAMFLNGLITNDVKTLAVNFWMPAAFANVQGRLLAVVRVLHREDGFLIDTEAETHQTVLSLLARFTMAGDFKVADLSSDTSSSSVQGRRAGEFIERILGDAAAQIGKGRVLRTEFDGGQVSVVRATHTAEDGFDLFFNRGEVAALRDHFLGAGAILVSDDVAETLRIEAGIARFGVDMDEGSVVNETNLDDAISFTKGCYTGQEIIIRIKHRGHVAKKLAGLVIEGQVPIERNAKILSSDASEIGRVTSSTFSPALERSIALGYLKYDYLSPGTKVRIVSGDDGRDSEVFDLPFVRGGWYDRKAE
jgi:folate-binding protein YgfZ